MVACLGYSHMLFDSIMDSSHRSKEHPRKNFGVNHQIATEREVERGDSPCWVRHGHVKGERKHVMISQFMPEATIIEALRQKFYFLSRTAQTEDPSRIQVHLIHSREAVWIRITNRAKSIISSIHTGFCPYY